MFKYLRTLNNSTHPTAIEIFPLSSEEDEEMVVASGSIVNVLSGEIAVNLSSDAPIYLVVKQEENTRNVRCIRLTPGAILEGDLSPNMDASNLSRGLMLDISPDDYGKGAYFCDNGEPRFEIIDTSNKRNKKVSAVFVK